MLLLSLPHSRRWAFAQALHSTPAEAQACPVPAQTEPWGGDGSTYLALPRLRTILVRLFTL